MDFFEPGFFSIADKAWLVPLVVLLLLLAVLIFTGEAVVPYIYALF